MTDDALWYKDGVLYELHVRSFQDSNGDGVGDFPGLTSRLDYLHSLGVDVLWLLPFFVSPLRDDGYDVADYLRINPEYGTLHDLKTFLDEAHRRGLRVIADLVLNHTSDQHHWFQEARRSRENPYRDYYVWSDTDQEYLGARIIFIDTEKSNWTWDPVAGQYFWHRFYSHQPDLNYDNPAVREEMKNILRFWLNLGLDGFRVDAVPYLFEREGTNCENLPETHAYVKELRALVEAEFPGRVLLAEANQWPEDVVQYFGIGDEFHMCFHFPLMPRIFMGLRRADPTPMVGILDRTPAIPPTAQWVTFLRNHDELTLEMVTHEERAYMWAEYAPHLRMKLNLGIRRRLAPLLDNDRDKILLANSLLLTLLGSPIIYYGDEIGMGDNIELDDRDGVRTPMQWSDEANAGFSTSPELDLPVIDDVSFGYQHVNVRAEESDPNSLLHAMRQLVARRKKYKSFGRGTTRWVEMGSPHVLAYERALADERVLVVNNLAPSSQPIHLGNYGGRAGWDILNGREFDFPARAQLERYEFLWLLLSDH